MSRDLFVISDIDGTLVPHPFLSGRDVEARRHSFERLLNLFRFDNFGIITGRRVSGFERFGSEYQLPIKYPAFLGVEFGAHQAIRGEWVVQAPQNDELARLLQSVEEAVKSIPTLNTNHNVEEALKSGKLESYYLELKCRIAQVESQFPDAERNRIFQETVEEIVNSQCINSTSLTLQNFASQRRFDIVERGFVPKSGFWSTIATHLLPRQRANPTTIVVLGDELYDSYMFRHLKQQSLGSPQHVVALAVSRPLPHADAVVADTETALLLVEELLGGSEPELVLGRRATKLRPL